MADVKVGLTFGTFEEAKTAELNTQVATINSGCASASRSIRAVVAVVESSALHLVKQS